MKSTNPDGGVWVKVHPDNTGGELPGVVSMYAKTADGWVEVGSSNVAAEGAPPAPVITNPEGGSIIKFTSGGNGAAGVTLAYGATIEPQGATVEVDQDNLEVIVSGSIPDTDYVVTVYGVNVAGKGEEVKTNPFQLNYNVATGGSENIVNNYNGTSEKWKVHTFTGNDTFTVESSVNNYRYVVVAGGGGAGGGSGNNAQGWTAGGGGSGGVLNRNDLVLPLGDIPITVGGGGGGAGHSDSGSSPRGGQGGVSKIDTYVVTTGGGGGNHSGGSGGSGGGGGFAGGNGGGGGGTLGQGTNGTGGNGQSQPAGTGGGAGDGTSTAHTTAGRIDNITGTDVTYANTYGAIGGGGPGNTRYQLTGASGNSGIVVIAYQIGMSTTREIEQAQAEQAARAAGVEEGIEQGKQEGYAQAQEEAKVWYNELNFKKE